MVDVQTHDSVIGFVGLGPMGRGMARNIVSKGGHLIVLGHKRRAPVEELIGLGASEAGSAAELGRQCDVVFLCLPSSRQVEEIVLGAGGLAESLGTGSLLIDCTTSEPGSTLKIAAILAAKGIRFIDAPLTRTSRDADAGRLNVLVGGAEADIKAAKPFIAYFAENIFPIGPIASAHKLKLINNFMTIGCSAVVIEAVAAARKLGVDTQALFKVVSVGGANSGAFQMIMPWVNEREMKFQFSVANAAKDIGYLAAATEPGVMGRAVATVMADAIAAGLSEAAIPQLTDEPRPSARGRELMLGD
ncbi:hypothetical protein X743_30180 [Mesorhizobium sp. LNHC252B00]|nr:NAD(P)-dependent oxidoreductase [Mesorhizobium sp. LNHC252B00]ESY64929.1 hypothetical protein X743_30180 [Mesorhizobium sp. LNHC252B00]